MLSRPQVRGPVKPTWPADFDWEGDPKSLSAKPNFLARSETLGSCAHESNQNFVTKLQL
jgi:hypothetical protein